MGDVPKDASCWTWGSLEVLFEQRFGRACGNKVLEHEGQHISRTLRRLPSNSGKSHTWRVDYTLKHVDGTTTRIDDPSTAVNRANDPSRNWGMGRGE